MMSPLFALVPAPILAALSTPAPGAPDAPEPIEIRDILPPVYVFPYPMWMVVVAGVIALILLGLLIWLFVRWLRKGPPPLPPLSPRAAALVELDKLRGQVQSLPPYGFSIAVSNVLRTYIGAQFGLHAPQQTSPEFLASISSAQNFSDEDRSLLAAFLDRCDMIKFARAEATAEDSEQLLSSAVSFVQGGRA